MSSRAGAASGLLRLAAQATAVVTGVAGLFLLSAFLSYHPQDLPLMSAQSDQPAAIRNMTGIVGAWAALIGRGGFGYAAFLLPLMLWMSAAQLWQGRPSQAQWSLRVVAALTSLASIAMLASLVTLDPTTQVDLGGLVGYLTVRAGRYYLGALGTGLVAGALAGGSLILLLDYLSIPWSVFRGLAGLFAWRLARREERADEPARGPVMPCIRIGGPRPAEGRPESSMGPAMEAAEESVSPRVRSTVTPKPKAAAAVMPIKLRQYPGGYQLPSLELLVNPPPISERKLGEDLQMNARILVETLREFGIEATCVNIDRGPSVTRYELAPAAGVKITKIVSLADDLALVLKAASCHIVAPIPGKGLVGVEVPNSSATAVYLREILSARSVQQGGSPLMLPIGKDVSGQPVIMDLRECPHLLVAGATGSGKTVCLNSLLTGILCQASPDHVKFVMIDPKMVELVLFNDIPHLVTPVVTDPKRAAAVLQWAVQEMERRYRRLSALGARHIEGYNQKAPPTPNEQGHGRMPYMVIVIDELADLMMVSARDVEESICRLAQMARAVGMHVILATQRPSVDVITGVIKANFPARVAFQVATKVDSRTILDVNGADKLLGRGDCLFLKPGTAKPIRAQGALRSSAS
jgi:S-DNA-T family DNA segregation ATPase FtsK/SpoIIIE